MKISASQVTAPLSIFDLVQQNSHFILGSSSGILQARVVNHGLSRNKGFERSFDKSGLKELLDTQARVEVMTPQAGLLSGNGPELVDLLEYHGALASRLKLNPTEPAELEIDDILT